MRNDGVGRYGPVSASVTPDEAIQARREQADEAAYWDALLASGPDGADDDVRDVERERWADRETARRLMAQLDANADTCAGCLGVVGVHALHQCVRCGRTDLCASCEAAHDCRTASERRVMGTEE